jgi:hypothetical protein
VLDGPACPLGQSSHRNDPGEQENDRSAHCDQVFGDHPCRGVRIGVDTYCRAFEGRQLVDEVAVLRIAERFGNNQPRERQDSSKNCSHEVRACDAAD